jgi:ATP-dependent Clp protease adaptor protein ClpS
VTEVLPVVEFDADVDLPWVAIVWNDPVNLMTYVTYIFQTLLGHPKAKAEKLMMDVHRRGRATVANGSREEMEVVVTKLQGAGLWATMAHDK